MWFLLEFSRDVAVGSWLGPRSPEGSNEFDHQHIAGMWLLLMQVIAWSSSRTVIWFGHVALWLLSALSTTLLGTMRSLSSPRIPCLPV